MRRRVIVIGFVWVFCSLFAAAGEESGPEGAIDRVLSTLHRAAADGEGEVYFSLFDEDAIFMGTDATERWTVDDFKAFAEPYFSQGRGWTYSMTERHIYLAADGHTAWFDEMLWNDTYGTCRGTGVLLLVEGQWLIVQYNLSIPMPNDLTRDFTARIKEFDGLPKVENDGS
jgi:hypothetical protein